MGQGEGWVKMGAEIRVRPKVSSNHQSEGRGLDRFFSEPQKETPTTVLNVDFWPPELRQ